MVLALYGFGGLGHELYDMAWLINEREHRWERIVAIDDFTEKEMVSGVSIYTYQKLRELYSPKQMMICICVGEPQHRKALYEKVSKDGYLLETLIHPDVHIPSSSRIAQGTIIASGTYISTDVEICENVLINVHSIVGHNVTLRKHSVLSPNVSIGGNCFIGENSYIAMSVPVKEHITVGNNTIVGMGSVVLRDIPEGVVAMGNPARAMAKNDGTVF